MSTSYSIYRFAKPKKHELSSVEYFSEYDSFPIYTVDGEVTNERIRLFRNTDKEVANIINTRFALDCVLSEKVIDYKSLFRGMGFNEKVIEEQRVHIKTSDGYTVEYTDGVQIKQIPHDDLKFYQKNIQTECIAVKMELFFASPFWTKLQNIFGHCCMSKLDKVAKHMASLEQTSRTALQTL